MLENKEDGWLKLEREWKPMHALRVKDGSIQSWMARPHQMNFAELVKKAYPQRDVNTLVQQTESARRMVRTEIWQVLEQTGPPVMGTK